jgi:hypothetical protein
MPLPPPVTSTTLPSSAPMPFISSSMPPARRPVDLLLLGESL